MHVLISWSWWLISGRALLACTDTLCAGLSGGGAPPNDTALEVLRTVTALSTKVKELRKELDQLGKHASETLHAKRATPALNQGPIFQFAHWGRGAEPSRSGSAMEYSLPEPPPLAKGKSAG